MVRAILRGQTYDPNPRATVEVAVRTALITGITGQDGQYLAEVLHGEGYKVYGLIKGQRNPKAEIITSEFPYVELVEGDLARVAVAEGWAEALDVASTAQEPPRRRSASR